ncbi:hypothetical protein L198_01652 [Cryptococcus wingfieldii CBS 7118]|uniref:RNB domain-containing protein n=1 Tax=Cryptococcus wingfieldii CBS 7118 TaxID=1295528 RepID=A0A1E3JZZ8_9TREE|nr:hypothetical protein L198_01652 [Cryptococcus wingfieldii CBS 7118]ODO06420.1 hypothetical protein L198_01652 [Cryptococcus wingfieldii CBS 7118]
MASLGLRRASTSSRLVKRALSTTPRSANLSQEQQKPPVRINDLLATISAESKSRNARLDKAGKIAYDHGEGQSMERRSYFASDVDAEPGLDWGSVGIAEEIPGLNVGRVVECRRSGQVSIGLILAAILVMDKPRLLLLRSTGEVWPISSNDVQFVMPSSLVPRSLAEECWSPEQLQSWSDSSEATVGLPSAAAAPPPEMMEARRKVSLLLRRVQRETEKMCQKLRGGVFKQGRVGGAEAAYEKWASEEAEERKCITAVEAAEYILNPQAGGTTGTPTTEVKPNTLPAYAAHVLLMSRPDMFISDQSDMWATGTYVVRSKPEQARIAQLQEWVQIAQKPGADGVESPVRTFVEKAKIVLDLARQTREETTGQHFKPLQHNLPEWSKTDLDIISCLLAYVAETRSTQLTPFLSLSLAITRLILSDPQIDRGTVTVMLQELGTILPWDSLETARIVEADRNAMTTTSVAGHVRGDDELLRGNELDELREDFSHHKVFVIDDATALELDDGIAVEKIAGSDDVWVHVHIADPTRYIPPGHELARQASVRGSSLYMAEGSMPLFPTDLIMKEVSLGANVERDDGRQGSMVFSARVSKAGNVEDSKVRMGWVKKPRVITYASVNKALGLPTSSYSRPFGGPSTSTEPPMPEITAEDAAELRLLYDTARNLRARRFATAGYEWSKPSASISLPHLPVGPNPHLFSRHHLLSTPQLFSGSLPIEYRVKTPVEGIDAGSLVAEYMVLGGRVAAWFCSERNLPMVYRASAAPSPVATSQTLEDLLAKRDPETGIIDAFATLGKGWYRPAGYISLQPEEHWIMGIVGESKGYVRATSPLRRFDDMLVHWQIKAALARQVGLSREHVRGFEKEDIVRLAQKSDEGVKRAKRAGMVSDMFWQTKVIGRNLRSGTWPLPEGWGKDETAVDVRDVLIGKVTSAPENAASLKGELTTVRLDQLGVSAKVLHPAGLTWDVGEEMKVKLDLAEEWPNPRIQGVRLV